MIAARALQLRPAPYPPPPRFSGQGGSLRAVRVRPTVGAGLAALLCCLGALALLEPAAAQTASGVCDRTRTVQDEIVNTLSGVSRCEDVTADHLANLITLDLGRRNINSLKAGDFAGLSKLQNLYLQNNRLTDLPATLFNDLSNLQNLYLQQNRLTDLPATLFNGLSELQTLNLYGNALTSLPATLFNGLSKLRVLNLGANGNIKDKSLTMPATLFNGLSNLESLDLTHNHLTSLPATLLNGLSNLQGLDLSDNHLTSLPATLLNSLSNLESLDLSDNHLTSLPATLLNGLSKLKHLLVQNNPALTSLPAGLFAGLANVENAYFSHAPLEVSLARVGNATLTVGTAVDFKVKIAQGVLRATKVRWRAEAQDGLVNGRKTVSGETEIEAGETDSGQFSVTGTPDTDGKPPRIVVIVDEPGFGQRPYHDPSRGRHQSFQGFSYTAPSAWSLDFGTGSAATRTTVHVGNAHAQEGNDIEFPVRLSQAVSSAVTLRWETADTTGDNPATTDNDPNTVDDYTAQSNGSLTIAAGATEGTITVATLEDEVSEPHETFYVNLSAPSLPAGVLLMTTQVVGTIDNDDLEISLQDVTIPEGQEIKLSIVLSHPILTAVKAASVTSAHGTTDQNDAWFRGHISNANIRPDYFETGYPIEPNVTDQSYSIGRALYDLEVDDGEYFTVTFKVPALPAGQGVRYKNNKNTARVTIRNVVPATLSIADAAAAEGDTVTFEATLDKILLVDVDIIWFTQDGTASSSDYLRRYKRWLTIPAGQTAIPLVVHTREDPNPEPDETFTVIIEGVNSPVFIGKPATGTIRNDDARITLADAAAEEGEAVEFTVTLSHPVAADVSLDWQTGDDATGDHPALSADSSTGDKADYTPVSNGSLTIPAGASAGTITVQTTEDHDKEQDETFIVTLREPGAGFPAGASLTLVDTEATGTIRNDDTPTLSIADASAEEGQPMTFTVTLGIVWPTDVTVDWSLQDDSATAPADYPENQGGSVIIATGTRTGTFTVQTTEDTLAEGAETFKAIIAAPAGGFPSAVDFPDTQVTINDAEAVGTITDNDTATVSIADATASEGTDVEFTVSLSTAASLDLILKWETTDGTGANAALSTGASPDYTPQSNASLTIPAGQTSATIQVPALIDTEVENPETFTVEVSAPAGGLPSWAALGDTVATGTITDDTTPPTVTFVPADGTKTGDVDTDVLVQFDEPVRQADGDPLEDADAVAAVELKKVNGDGTDLAGAGRVSINNDKTVITIDPQNALAPGSYTVTLLQDTVEDEQGNQIDSDQSATFTVDTAAPTVTFVPADGDTVATVNTNVEVRFNEPVRQADGNALTVAAATAALTLVRVGDGSNTDLTAAALVTVNPAKTVITINPAAALVSGARYTVTLPANTVEDEQGNEQGAEQSATFTVDTAAPTVTFVPAHGTKTGNVDTDVLVQFDEAVRQADGNALTVAAATAALTLVRVGDGSNTDLTAAALVTVNPAKTVITINPAAALVSGARYTVTLPVNTVEDEQGNEQGAEQSATFTVDTAAPTVTFVPAHGTKTGNVDTDVLVQFDEPVRQADGNALTVAAATAALTLVRVGDGSNTDLTAAALVTVNPAKTVITINPAAALVSGARYTVTLPVNTVEDEQGNEQGAEQSATFTVDTAAPTVTFVPAHGTKTGNVDTDVLVQFDEPVRQADGNP